MLLNQGIFKHCWILICYEKWRKIKASASNIMMESLYFRHSCPSIDGS